MLLIVFNIWVENFSICVNEKVVEFNWKFFKFFDVFVKNIFD